MPFSAPLTEIDKVLVFSPQTNRDDYFYNGQSGASISVAGGGLWLPTAPAASSFGRFQNSKVAVLQDNTAAAAAPMLVFPAVSRYPYDTSKTTMVIEFKLSLWFNWTNLAVNTADACPFVSYSISNPQPLVNGLFQAGWGLFLYQKTATTLGVKFACYNDIGGTEVITTALEFGIDPLNINFWNTFKVVITPTSYTLYFNGVVAATSVRGWDLNVVFQSDLVLRTNQSSFFPNTRYYWTEFWTYYL